jgi:hypothetical protein
MELQLKQNNPQNEPAFVLGNGRSRLVLDAPSLLQHGTVYACNAVYREFDPDYLIAVDVKMVNEIVASGYHRTHSVWTNPNKGINDKQFLNYFNPHKGWSSGPTALNFSCERGHKEVFIFGFDFEGINGHFNNVYADTYNYKRSDDVATYHGNWLAQTEKTIRDYRRIQFFRIIPEGGFVPDKLGYDMMNLKHITFDEFADKYPGTIYSKEINQKSTI